MASPHLHQDVFSLTACLSHAPHWDALVLGPVPFGNAPGDRVSFTVNVIVVPARDEAEAVVWAWVRHSCEACDYAFDEDEWDIVRLASVNCN